MIWNTSSEMKLLKYKIIKSWTFILKQSFDVHLMHFLYDPLKNPVWLDLGACEQHIDPDILQLPVSSFMDLLMTELIWSFRNYHN